MVEIKAETDIDRIIVELLERKLRKFPLFEEPHIIKAFLLQNKQRAGYFTDSHEKGGTTHFDLSIQKSVCEIISFEIQYHNRTNGHGRRLYEIVENFARAYGCKSLQVTPAVHGITFWPYMGFTRPCEIGVEKLL